MSDTFFGQINNNVVLVIFTSELVYETMLGQTHRCYTSHLFQLWLSALYFGYETSSAIVKVILTLCINMFSVTILFYTGISSTNLLLTPAAPFQKLSFKMRFTIVLC